MGRAADHRSSSHAASDVEDVRWLTAEEETAWRALMVMMGQLPWALEDQLQRDAELSLVEYHVLAMLSERPDHTTRMSELSAMTKASLSRLSHLFKRLEARGLVRREPDPKDGRYTLAILTDAGYRHLVTTAPGHVREVRNLVMEGLTAEQVKALGRIAAQVLERLGVAAPERRPTVKPEQQQSRNRGSSPERPARRRKTPQA